MRNLSALALVVLAAAAGPASAVEIKNVRAANGPLGALRKETKYVPGDRVVILCDVEDLKTDVKTGEASVLLADQLLQVRDGEDKVIRGNTPDKFSPVPLLGGKRLPAVVSYFLPVNTKPGTYKIRVVAFDGHTKDPSKDAGKATFTFEVVEKKFAIVQTLTPAVGFMGENLPINFSVVGMKRDKAKNLPDCEVAIQLLQDGKPVVPAAIISNLKDVPPAAGANAVPEVMPVFFPIILNRAGTFTIEIRATDNLNGKKMEVVHLPLTVIDPSKYLDKGAGE